MNRMDLIDRWSFAAMAVLIAWFVLLVGMHDVSAPKSVGTSAFVVQQASPEFVARMNTSKNLMRAGNMEKLKELLDGTIKDYPYQAEPFMMLGDYYIRLQNPLAAMHAFRQALDLNLDYLERNTPLYQGKKIRSIVREAEEQINAVLATNPKDSEMLKNRTEVYYMLRKLAGGCSD